MEKKIKELASKYQPVVAQIRRYLHAHPELSNQEYATKQYIKEILEMLGIEHEDMLETGIVAIIRGGKPGKTVLLRADMDALPIQEEADVPYKSLVPGVMHACGHDGHVAGLLGAAMILNTIRGELFGNVKLMFQPAEENQGGAERMIKAGILENPHVDAAFGLHLWGGYPENTVYLKKGALMSAADFFSFTIHGRGGHAAEPETAIDPINLAMQALNSMQNIISRRIKPVDPAVLSFCSIHAGEAANVIPQDIEIKGTIRTFSQEARTNIPKMMEEILQGLCDINGATYEFDFQPKYPAVLNDAAMTDLVTESVAKIVGTENVVELLEPQMTAEDFSYFGYELPSTFYFYGIKPHDNRREVIHHHPFFEWDEAVLEGSGATLAQIAYDFLATNAASAADTDVEKPMNETTPTDVEKTTPTDAEELTSETTPTVEAAGPIVAELPEDAPEITLGNTDEPVEVFTGDTFDLTETTEIITDIEESSRSFDEIMAELSGDIEPSEPNEPTTETLEEALDKMEAVVGEVAGTLEAELTPAVALEAVDELEVVEKLEEPKRTVANTEGAEGPEEPEQKSGLRSIFSGLFK